MDSISIPIGNGRCMQWKCKNHKNTQNVQKAAEYANMRGIKGQSFLENDAMSRRRILSGENVKHNKQTNPTTKPAFLSPCFDFE